MIRKEMGERKSSDIKGYQISFHITVIKAMCDG